MAGSLEADRTASQAVSCEHPQYRPPNREYMSVYEASDYPSWGRTFCESDEVFWAPRVDYMKRECFGWGGLRIVPECHRPDKAEAF